MSKPNSTSPTGRRSSPQSPTSTHDPKKKSNSASGGAMVKTPTLKQPGGQKIRMQKESIAPEEDDGSILKNHPEFDDYSSDEEGNDPVSEHWEKRFDEHVQFFDAREKKARHAQDKKAPNEGVEPGKYSTMHVAGEKIEPATDPQLKKRSRAGTFRDTLREGMARVSRGSMNHDNMQALTLGELAALPWKCIHAIGTDSNGFPVLESMPPKLSQRLANEYLNFADNKRHEGLSPDAKDQQLKDILAKHFLAFVLMDSTSQFNKEKIGSPAAINQYLLSHFGLKIDVEPTAVTATNSARTQRGADDFRDLLTQNAVLHAKNYRVAHSVDLGNLTTDPFVKKVFDGTIEATKKNETVTQTANQRTDVTATFQRDFPNSVYEYESADGAIRPFKSVDEFVQFIGDPLHSGLPKQVSHFACQNTGIFIKNLLFTKTDGKGQPQSPLKLFDDTPLAISSSPSANYRLKKAADGTVTLQYRSEIDTTGAGAQGKNTARLLVPENQRPVLIENARAVCTLNIAFAPDGTVRLDTLHFNATGWNQISE